MSKNIKLASFFRLILLLQVFQYSAIYGQNTTSVDTQINLLNDYNAKYPLEKVYLHTDRQHYAPGETIWFQAYVAGGFSHQPTLLSNNVYVALFSSEKELISQLLLRVDEGVGNGVIDLPATLPGGSYIIRAYTNWMKNFDDAFYFQKELIVIGQDENPAGKIDDSVRGIDLQFFPEGGALVENVATRVAFKVTDNLGRPLNVSGTIYDQNNQEVTSFNATHDGMGVLVLSPQKGSSYSARISKSPNVYRLPKVEARGFGISINNKIEDILRLTFRSNEATDKTGKFGVLIHTRGAISYAFDIDLSKNIAFANLPKASIPAGIAHITLFNGKGKAVLERLVYNDKPADDLKLTIDQKQYEKRSRVSATLKVKDPEGNPVTGNFSLSVFDLGQTVDEAPENTIVSELLLASDLKGHIENPSYYFDKNNPLAKEHLDLLMMTHGWTRFFWDEFSAEGLPIATYPVEQSLSLKGTLMRKGSDKPEANGKVTLINQQLIPPLFLQTSSDKNGYFEFNNITIREKDEIVLQGENRKGKDLVEFRLDTTIRVDPPEISGLVLKGLPREADDIKSFAERNKYRELIDESYNFDSTATLLETVVVEGKRSAVRDEEEEKRSVYGRGETTFRYDEGNAILSASNPLEAIQGKIAGVQISGSGTSISINIRGAVTGSGTPAPALILLDDVPTNVDLLVMLPANSIERVEVFKGPSAAIFGVRGSGGVLAFYSKTGNDIAASVQVNGLLTTMLKNSYHQTRAFYAPKYSVKKPEHIKPDSRILLHWQPHIILDSSGTATIEFWNSDEETSVLLDLQGITSEGTPLSTVLQYEIIKD